MPSGDPINNAIDWLSQLLVGEMATAVAVIAVAGVGFATLQGYFSYRDCIRVIAGCALVFGAPTIGRSLYGFYEF